MGLTWRRKKLRRKEWKRRNKGCPENCQVTPQRKKADAQTKDREQMREIENGRVKGEVTK